MTSKTGKVSSSLTDIRLKTFPQMLSYDKMTGGRQTPYSMLSGPVSYQSSNINTDNYGFRKSKFQNQMLSVSDLESIDSVNFLIGGSTVFGVGATDDSTTISSMLSQRTNKVWINLGLRGGVSFQELIHLMHIFRKAKKIENIIFFSGINDIYTNFLQLEKSIYDHAVNEIDIEFVSKSLKRQLICKLFSKIYSCRTKDLQELPIKKIVLGQFVRSHYEEHNPIDTICDIIQRNFLLYRGIKSLVSGQVGFVLQPFFPWTNKTASPEEKVTLDYLNQLQAQTLWPEIRDAIAKPEVHNKIIDCYNKASALEGIPFEDSNKFFSTNETLFVDSVHLSDKGNSIAADVIIKKFNL